MRHFALDPAERRADARARMAMQATVNGDRVELPDGLTVAQLLLHLGVRAERVAVERNGAVIKRARHGEEKVAPGDVLEIVTFVGGG
jgi:sulfur carrier protein